MHLNNQPSSAELNTANSKLRTLWLQISDVVSLKIIVITFVTAQNNIAKNPTQTKPEPARMPQLVFVSDLCSNSSDNK